MKRIFRGSAVNLKDGVFTWGLDKEYTYQSIKLHSTRIVGKVTKGHVFRWGKGQKPYLYGQIVSGFTTDTYLSAVADDGSDLHLQHAFSLGDVSSYTTSVSVTNHNIVLAYNGNKKSTTIKKIQIKVFEIINGKVSITDIKSYFDDVSAANLGIDFTFELIGVPWYQRRDTIKAAAVDSTIFNYKYALTGGVHYYLTKSSRTTTSWSATSLSNPNDSIVGEGGTMMGHHVAINGEGNIIFAGARRTHGGGLADTGEIRVYEEQDPVYTDSSSGTSLVGAIGYIQTEIWVGDNSAGNLEAVVGDYIKIVNEIVKVTAIAGTHFVVIRGQGGTANVEHSDAVVITKQVVTNWALKGNITYGEDANGDSYAVACSSSGLSFVHSSPDNQDGGYNYGEVRVFDFDELGNTWVQRGQDIHGIRVSGWFGGSLAMSDDGNIIAVGSVDIDDGSLTDCGAVVFYQYQLDKWEQMGQIIYGTVANGHFGLREIDLSNDGNTFIAGAGHDGADGYTQIYTFSKSLNRWVQRGTDIMGSDKAGLSYSNRLNGDGTIYAVSSRIGSTSAQYGYVDVFRWDGLNHIGLGQRILGDDDNDRFGFSMDLNEAGNILAIGTSMYADGEVRIFKYNPSTNLWVKQGDTLSGEADGGPSGGAYGNFGYSVRLNKLGNRMIAGHPYNDSSSGDNGGEVKIYNDYASGSGWGTLKINDANGDLVTGHTASTNFTLSGTTAEKYSISVEAESLPSEMTWKFNVGSATGTLTIGGGPYPEL